MEIDNKLINLAVDSYFGRLGKEYSVADSQEVLRKALLEAADELDAVAVKPDGSLVKFTVKLGAMTDAERRILADGCLINYYKNN